MFVFFNIGWMMVNIGLALVSVICTILLRKKHPFWIYIVLLGIWFLFFPNTIYIVTDGEYFPKQFIQSSILQQLILVIQYSCLILVGIITYNFAYEPFDTLIKKWKNLHVHKKLIYILFNFLLAFAVTLGKFPRTESWYLITNPPLVIHDFFSVISSPHMILTVIVFGICFNIIYFSCKKFQRMMGKTDTIF